MTGDISAVIFDPRQAYSSVRMQQGRVITDADWNEAATISENRLRALLNDIICGYGSTNDGFRLTAAEPTTMDVPTDDNGGTTSVPTYDVRLAGGTFLLGGLSHRWPEGDLETLLAQRDDLQITASQSALPTQPAEGRVDLVYLVANEHSVRAVEDRELRERALGGPDTTTRLKARRRVGVLANVPDSCTDAAAALRDFATAPADGDTSNVAHDFDRAACEVCSKVRLTVDFIGEGENDDPCTPTAMRGYLGAENNTIRVQLRDAGHFLWAYDNGEPFYRVQLTRRADDGIDVTFLTPPRDPLLFPLQGSVIEILPWGCLLPNREKVAEATGYLGRITQSYNPETATLAVDPDDLAAWRAAIGWVNSTDRDTILSPRDPEDQQHFFFARIWQPGPEDSANLTHAFSPGAVTPLGRTGLTLTFSDFGLPQDAWSIAVRPNTPEEVVPWRLLTEAPPMEPRRHVAALGLVRWQSDGDGGVVADLHDCRHRFRKLCDLETCCTLHVGDGETSQGDVDDLQAAIDLLPPEGGEICLLPGRHTTRARVESLERVVIQGCGARSVLVPDVGQTEPVLTLRGNGAVTIRNLAIASDEAVGIFGEKPGITRLHQLDIQARARAAVLLTDCKDAWLEDSNIRTERLTSVLTDSAHPVEPAVFMAGYKLAVRRCRIWTLEGRASLTAHGGVQIGGDSTDVEIVDTDIRGGSGAGIVLGSVDFQPRRILQAPDTLRIHYANRKALPNRTNKLILKDHDDCPAIHPRPRRPTDDLQGEERLEPVSDGSVVDCRIRDCRIAHMGDSGITVAYWFDPESESDTIVTDQLLIEGTEIRDCMRLPATDLSAADREIVAFGGITLAVGAGIIVRNNTIVDVGTRHNTPICGFCMIDGEGIALHGNRIADNGRIATINSQIAIGRAGGIVITMARPGTDQIRVLQSGETRQDGTPAATISDNTVVAREGRALTLIGVGPMFVHGNRFTAHGSNTLSRLPVTAGATIAQTGFNVVTLALIGLLSVRQTTNPLMTLLDVFGGSAVAILNLGVSNEYYLQLRGLSGLGQVDAAQPDGSGEFNDDVRLLAGGNVLFNDNQVVFDSLSDAVTLSLSSIFVFSLDDVSIADNQFDCDLLLDFVGINALALGWSLRVQGNRFKEGYFNAFLSALTLGLLNDTTHNQGTHCFVPAGLLMPEIQPGPATLDSNRHIAPVRSCQLFLAKRTSLLTGAGLKAG